MLNIIKNERIRIQRVNESNWETSERRPRRRRNKVYQDAKCAYVHVDSQNVDVEESVLLKKFWECFAEVFWKSERNSSNKYANCWHDE